MEDPYRSHRLDHTATLPTVFRHDPFAVPTVLVSGGAGGIGATATLLARLQVDERPDH